MMRGYGLGYGLMGRGVGLGGNWLLHVLGGLFWLAIVVGIVALIVVAVSSKHQHGHVAAATPVGPVGGAPEPPAEAIAPLADPAVEIARARYATGEITKKQFEEIVETLTNWRSGVPAL